MALGSAGGKNGKDAKGKPGAAGKMGGGMGNKSGGMGNKSGGMGNKPGMGSKSTSKSGGFGASSSSKSGGGFGSKPGSSSKPGLGGSSKPGLGGSSKPGMGSKPGLGGSSKPSSSGFGSKPSSSSVKPGMVGGSKPGLGGKPGSMIAGKPGGALGVKPGGALGAKAGSSIGAKPGPVAIGGKAPALGAAKPGLGSSAASKMGGSRPGAIGVAKSGGLTVTAGAKPAIGSRSPSLRPQMSHGKDAGKVGFGQGASKSDQQQGGSSMGRPGQGGQLGRSLTVENDRNDRNRSGSFGRSVSRSRSFSGLNDRDERNGQMVRGNVNGGVASDVQLSGMSRNIPLSQMDRMDITKMTPRELMMLERQYGAGWLKTLAPTQHMRLQNQLGGTALTSSTPTALSSHMDPRQLQVAAGIAGTGFVAAQLSSSSEDQQLDSPSESHDKSVDLTVRPYQSEEQDLPVLEDERMPSDLMLATTIDVPVIVCPPSPIFDHSAPPTPCLPDSAPPLYPDPYHGDNLHRGDDPSSHFAPLLDKEPHEPQLYQQFHTPLPPVNHFSSYNGGTSEKFMYNNALQNYNMSSAAGDGMYCYSCVMFFGVILIGVGIIMVIVEVFGLFGTKIYLAIGGGVSVLIGIITLATAMLAWRRRRTRMKKKLVSV